MAYNPMNKILLISCTLILLASIPLIEAYDPSEGTVSARAVFKLRVLFWSWNKTIPLFTAKIHEGVDIPRLERENWMIVEGEMHEGTAVLHGSIRLIGGKIVAKAGLKVDVFGIASGEVTVEFEPTDYPIHVGVPGGVFLEVTGPSAQAYYNMFVWDETDGCALFSVGARLTYPAGLDPSGDWPFEWDWRIIPGVGAIARHPHFSEVLDVLPEHEIWICYWANATSREADSAAVYAGIPVGGIWIPVDKFGLLAPYIGLASTIVAATAATAIYAKRVKRRKENQ